MSRGLSRREFLRQSALAAGSTGLFGNRRGQAAGAGAHVTLVVPSDDRVAAAPQARWALEELRLALGRRGLAVTDVPFAGALPRSGQVVVVANSDGPAASAIFEAAGVRPIPEAEALALVGGERQGSPFLLASGHDARGLMYAVLELADRVEHAEDPLRALEQTGPIVERPFNPIRAIGRPFVSDVEDMPWFRDRAFWPSYFGMLARHRFNRFHLALGFGYDTLRWVTDAYLLFPYPFLVGVPGYDVRAAGLPDAERDRNLDMLRFISREAVAHGLDFQLGIWTHGYVWDESPDASFTIAGLTPAIQAAYCRDALTEVLRACPDITGVTVRTHYESGVREGNYAFWKTIFDGVPRAGRTIEIELHTKGLDRRLIDAALATGMPVRLSAKYWAEHIGLPYHQTAIRALELPRTDPGLDPFSALSFGARQHTRYGYADFLEDDRPYGMMFRVFPGTHKFLLWGDPVTAAAHARAFRFCGSQGAEWLEPLAFKGRRGSGIAGGRCAYIDADANPVPDWEKYRYTYAVWGRLLYNPDCDPEVWRRVLRARFGRRARPLESALGAATRILPLVSTAHTPSAAQDTFSPEFYANQSIVQPPAPAPYGDTPSAKVFANVSPLDPEIFSSIDEYVGSLLASDRRGKYSPIEVARWLDALADEAGAGLAGAAPPRDRGSRDELERALVDVRIQTGIGRFFAAKFRSAALYAVFEKAGSRRALGEALRMYRQARGHWAALAREASRVYRPDITFGPLPHQRGHWIDRLAAIDADIDAMDRAAASAPASPPEAAAVAAAIEEILGQPARIAPACRHVPPGAFARGAALEVSLAVQGSPMPASVTLRYRHVNQAERYRQVEMAVSSNTFRAEIPAAYTDSPYPMQYYFEGRSAGGGAWLHPGLGPDLTTVPYYVVRQAAPRAVPRRS